MSILNDLLQKRNGKSEISWSVGRSGLSGQGIIAKRDINVGEIIFEDFPIAVGPRTSEQLVACVGCFDVKKTLKKCTKCPLPVCSLECENSTKHEKECAFLMRIQSKGDHWSNALYKSLAPLRCLFITDSERSIVEKLYSNSKRSVQKNMEIIKNEVGSLLSEDDMKWIEHCVGVFHGTAFEVELNADAPFSVQGLYPLGAMMNHDCCPNTRHHYGRNNPYTMYVIASKPIKKGDEITTHYCSLFWATNARRIYLDVTKEFKCKCLRCQDPKEFGSFFSALLCKCKGPVVPISSLVYSEDWKCESCPKTISALEVAVIQNSVEKNMNLLHLLHPNNSLRVRLKMRTIHQKIRTIQDLTIEDLKKVKQLTNDVLDVIDKLKLGETRTKGMLVLKLYQILKEEQKRNLPVDLKLLEESLRKAKEILSEDSTAPEVI